jgi:signal transduction histidine kinase
VFVASDGLAGVSLAQKVHPNLILMDINLPYIDGRALTTRLRSLPVLEKTPIVALTADITDGSRELALAAGCAGFLNKPVDVDKFPRQIESYLKGQTQELDEATHHHHLQIHAENVVEQLETKIRELEKVNNLLFKLDRMKSDFIILASHELYTPLTLVSGYSNLLDEQLNHDDAAETLDVSRDIAKLLNTSVERMGQVVHEIMSVARIASGRLELSTGPVQMKPLIDGVLSGFSQILDERNLNVSKNGVDELPLIYGDGAQLKTAVSNIIENAIKFTPNGGEIRIEAHNGADHIHMSIADTGIGIPNDEIERIFEQFYTLGNVDHHSSSKSAFEGGGMGLGLTIASGIIEAHNGRIWAESLGLNKDKLPGSTFYIELPITPPDDVID